MAIVWKNTAGAESIKMKLTWRVIEIDHIKHKNEKNQKSNKNLKKTCSFKQLI